MNSSQILSSKFANGKSNTTKFIIAKYHLDIKVYKKLNPEYKDYRSIVQFHDIQGVQITDYICIGLSQNMIRHLYNDYKMKLEEYIETFCTK